MQIVSIRITAPGSTLVAIKLDDGTEVHTDTALPPDTPLRVAMHEWFASGGVATDYVPPPASRIVTPREFRMRFTPEERGAITLAAAAALSQSDPTLQGWLDDLASAVEIDLDHPEIIAGVDGVIALGLVAANRRNALLG